MTVMVVTLLSTSRKQILMPHLMREQSFVILQPVVPKPVAQTAMVFSEFFQMTHHLSVQEEMKIILITS